MGQSSELKYSMAQFIGDMATKTTRESLPKAVDILLKLRRDDNHTVVEEAGRSVLKLVLGCATVHKSILLKLMRHDAAREKISNPDMEIIGAKWIAKYLEIKHNATETWPAACGSSLTEQGPAKIYECIDTAVRSMFRCFATINGGAKYYDNFHDHNADIETCLQSHDYIADIRGCYKPYCQQWDV